MTTHEPCGGDFCISPQDLKMMGERIDRAERRVSELEAELSNEKAEVDLNTKLLAGVVKERDELETERETLRDRVCLLTLDLKEAKEWRKQHANDLQLIHAQVMGLQATVGEAALENLERAVKAEAACIAKDIAIRQALTWDTPRREMIGYLEPALTPDIGAELLERYKKATTEYASLTSERDEAVAAVATMRGALEKAVAVIHSWHNLDGRKMPEEVQQRMWQIYRDDAPEMKPIREALATSLGAETLEYIRGLEGFLAEVRGRYEAALSEGIDRIIVQAAEAGGAGEILADIVSRRFMAEIVFEPEFYVEGGDAK